MCGRRRHDRRLPLDDLTISGSQSSGGGGAIFNAGTLPVTVTNSILANSPTGGNCSAAGAGGPITDGGHNIDDGGTKKGVRYRDPSGSSDGLVTLVIRTGKDGRAGIVVRSKGRNLPLPPLPLLAPVTVQLQSSDGVCWETTDGTK